MLPHTRAVWMNCIFEVVSLYLASKTYNREGSLSENVKSISLIFLYSRYFFVVWMLFSSLYFLEVMIRSSESFKMTRLFENPHLISGDMKAATTDHNRGRGSADTVAQDQFFGTRILTELSSKRTVFSVISPDSSRVPGRLQLESPITKNVKIKKRYIRISN